MNMYAPFLVVGKVGATELIVILLIVLVLFGPKQLPKLSKMFGKTIKNFKEGMEEDDVKDEKEGKASEAKNDSADVKAE